MATQSVPSQSGDASVQTKTGFLSNHQRRSLQENITAYLFLAPAAILIFTFGIFPIFYATYVSLYKWRIKQGEYRGLANFVNAMGDLAYVFFLLIIITLIGFGIVHLIRMIRNAREENIPVHFALSTIVPGAILSYGLVQILLRFITFFTQQDAIDKGYAEILGNIPLGLGLILLASATNYGITRWQHAQLAESEHTKLPSFATPGVLIAGSLLGAFALAQFTYGELIDSGTAPIAWVRIRATLSGLALLTVAYLIWNWAMKQYSNTKLIAGIVGAALFIGGGVYFVSIWPIITDGADPDFFLSFTITIFFAGAAVPLQLGIALVLATLLYQNIKGKTFFRIVFFIPYIAPTVAGAAVFQVLFTLRETSLANRAIQFLTRNPDMSLRWLKEPSSLISVIGEAFGYAPAADWEFGPSLALFVVIAFSVWRYVGYDTVIFLAGLGGIPGVLYEAAEIDGASRWQLFRHVTLPLLSPTTFFLSVITVLGTFKAFNSIWVLRDAGALGTIDTASIYFFETFQRGARFGYAASMAIVLFVVMLTLTFVQNRLAEKRVFYG